MADAPTAEKKAPLKDILAYSMGDGANSLVMNTFYGFAMLYYTKALGMSGTQSGLAAFITTMWDAITDPLMGHITDNTRSRFGRRHPYMLIGGVLMLLCFYAVWNVPSVFKTPQLLFWYLVGMNVALRTASTIFGVPFVALGFEICTDYNQRTTLQSVRGAINMAFNLLGPAILGWSVFLRDRGGPTGSGVTVAANFESMGLVFAAIALVLLLFMVFTTRKYALDSRGNPEVGRRRAGGVLLNLKEVLFDPYPRTVFILIGILYIAVVIVTTLQMYIYVDFMKFNEWEKTLVHGGTMVAAALGALLVAPMVRRIDKKPSVYVFLLIACIGNIILVILFGSGWIQPGLSWKAVPVATLVFMLFHVCYHLGGTAANTVASSMMADVSEIGHYRTGILKDGAYSAMLSFVLKFAIAISQLGCGFALDIIGIKEAGNSPEVARQLMLVAFIGGTAVTVLAMIFIARYPVNRRYMAEIRAAAAGRVPPCRNCGYDLMGNVSGVCPECGTPIVSEDATT